MNNCPECGRLRIRTPKETPSNIAHIVANKVYDAVYCHVYMHEIKGHNAHSFAQSICEDTRQNVKQWLELQGLKDDETN